MKIAQVALQKVNQVVFFTPTEKSSTELVPTTCHFFQTLFKISNTTFGSATGIKT